MAGFDWDAVAKDLSKVGMMWGVPQSKPKEDMGPEPALVAPMSEQQELLAASQMPAESSAQIQPQVAPTQQVVPQPRPAGMIPVQTSTQSISLPPKLLAKQEEITGRQLEAQDMATKAQIAQNELLTQHAQSQAIEAAAANQRAATQLAYDNEQQQAKMADLQQKVQEYDDNKTVNPNRHADRMGIGGRILATIGQAFGAFGSALTHSPNYAQQMIERAVDADIRAQEQDIAARGHAVNMANNTVAMFRQKGLDNQASLAATRLQMLQASGAKIDEIMASTKNPQILAAGAQMKAGLEQSANNTLMHYGQVSRNTTSVAPGAGGPAGTQLPAGESEKLGTANAAIQAAKDTYKDWDKSAKGVYGFVTSFFPNTDASRFSDSRSMAKQIVGSYLEGGVLRKEDEAKYDKFLPERGDSAATALNKRDHLIALIATRAEAQRKAHRQAGFNVDNVKIDKPVTTFKPIE